MKKSGGHPQEQLLVNVRLLCFEAVGDLDRWADRLGVWIRPVHRGWSDGRLLERADEVLAGRVHVELDEASAIADALHEDVQDLLYQDRLVGRGRWVLQQNMRRLMPRAGGASLGQIARDLGLSSSTLSRWKAGTQVPDRKTLARLQALLGLPANVDLERDPLFLSYLPVTHAERVNWIQQRVGRADPEALTNLYPAIRLIVEGLARPQ